MAPKDLLFFLRTSKTEVLKLIERVPQKTANNTTFPKQNKNQRRRKGRKVEREEFNEKKARVKERGRKKDRKNKKARVQNSERLATTSFRFSL